MEKWRRYFVAIFNNDLYLQEPAQLQLTARWSPEGAAPLCPWNCTDHGRCLNGSVCRCNPGDAPLVVLNRSSEGCAIACPFCRMRGS